MVSLKEISSVIKQLEECGSTKGKEYILKSNESDMLKKILFYTYNDDMKYGVSKKALKEFKYDAEDDRDKWGGNLFKMLDELSVSNINNYLKDNVRKHINYYTDEEVRELIKKILGKDMKCGISKSTINKVFKGLLPTFNQMKSYSYDDKTEKQFNNKAEKEGYIMMIKENGIKGIVIVEDGKVIVKTRQNKVVEGLYEIEEAFSTWENGVYEGEFLAVGDFKTSKEQFKVTDKIHSSKGKRGGLFIKLFDYIPLDDFNSGHCDIKAIDRKAMVEDMVIKHGHKLVSFVDVIYIGRNTDIIKPKLKEVSEGDRLEGLMIQLCNSEWEGGKKVKHTLKCKLWKTADLEVIGLKESDEKPNTLGSLILNFKDQEQGCSGISDELKELWWNNPNEIIGKIIECKFKEVTQNKNGGEGLQFCTFVRIRHDKTKNDINID